MYESIGYTLTKMLSEIGGLASLCYAVAKVCSFVLTKDAFLGSLIEVLFRVRTSETKETEA